MITGLFRSLTRWLEARERSAAARAHPAAEPSSTDRVLEALTREALSHLLQSPEQQKRYAALARLVASSLPAEALTSSVGSRAGHDASRELPSRGGTDEATGHPARFSARITFPQKHSRGDICHAGHLTAYAAETVADDALRAGRGARLELIVASTASDAVLARLRAQLDWLRDRGVRVDVHRGRIPGDRPSSARRGHESDPRRR